MSKSSQYYPIFGPNFARRICSAFVFVAFTALGVEVVMAQSYRGGLVGTVSDQTGAPVPDVKVAATKIETNETLTAVTGRDGVYILPHLSPGKYKVVAERYGFAKFELSELTLQMDLTARVDISLAAGQVSEQVNIAADAPLVNSETASLGTVISTKEIGDIPLNGRNYLSLAALNPGVVPAAAGSNPLNINGSRSDYVNYLIDGVSNVNRRGNEPVMTPSLDAIGEFKIITNAYSAEYGRLAAGVVSVALKSGTNQFNGSIYEFLRNERLDARSFFDSRKQKVVRNQFGGILTGPIRRDSTFFVLSYEGLRSLQGQTMIMRVPTVPERSGIFSTAVRNPFTGQAFAANTITPALISPIANALLAYLPLPNRVGTLNYSTAGNTREDQDTFLAKLDHQFSSRDELTAQVMVFRSRGSNPFRSTALPGYGSERAIKRELLSAAYRRSLGERSYNELRVGYLRDKFDEISVNSGKNTSAEVGITGTGSGYGLANLVISGFPELGDATFLPDRWNDRELSIADTFTTARGRHLLSFGGDYQRSAFTNLFASFAGGQIAFNGAFTLNPFADFLLGLPIQTQRQVGTNNSRLTSSYFGVFIQDNWRLLPGLNINLGLRYDVNTPPVEKDDHWANFIVDARSQIAAGTAGYPRALVKSHFDNFSPRIGLAFRPFGDGRTSIRAGYGIFNTFDLQFTQYQLLGASAFPFTRLELFQTAGAGNPSLANPFPNRPGLTPGALSPNGWEYDNPTPYMQNWNLTLAHELFPGMAVEASYVGSKGTHLSSTANINQTVRTAQGNVVPFPGLGRILFQRLGANSSYNALQISVQKRMSGGLAFRSAFTWSRSIDNASFGSPARLPQNPNDLASERALSEFDRRRVWNSDFIYELPFGRGRHFGASSNSLLQGIFGGWQISGLVQLADGRPFTPIASRANTQAGFPSRPDRIGTGLVSDPTVERWFDPAAFVVVPTNQFRFGNSGRNILIGPSIVSIDMAVFKQFAMPWENQRLQIRAEIFNLPNHANLGQPDARIDQPTAGFISTAGPGRQVQLALKYLF